MKAKENSDKVDGEKNYLEEYEWLQSKLGSETFCSSEILPSIQEIGYLDMLGYNVSKKGNF